MSASPLSGKAIEQAILDRWVARVMDSYPAEALPFLRSETDPFRNPVGHTLRESLAVLTHQLLGGMELDAIAPALDTFIHLRAVQDFSPDAAVRFIFDVRAAMRETSGAVPDEIQDRIDTLALMAFNQYMSCREQIFELRSRGLLTRSRQEEQ